MYNYDNLDKINEREQTLEISLQLGEYKGTLISPPIVGKVFGLFEYQENINIRQAIQNLIETLANIIVIDDDGNELIELKPDKNLLNFNKDY